MTAFVEHPTRCLPPLNTDGMDDFERQAAENYAQMVGLDRSREERLADARRRSSASTARRARHAG